MTDSPFSLNFCYHSSHGSTFATGPPDVIGLKPHKKVVKLLRAFCRNLKMKENDLEEEVRSLEIGKCFCGSSASPAPSFFTGQDLLRNVGVNDGDRIFVRRIHFDMKKKEKETEPVEKEKKTDLIQSEQYQSSTKAISNGEKVPKASSIAVINSIKAKIIESLGGDRFLSTPFCEFHFIPSHGISYWTTTRSVVNYSLKLTPASEIRKNGLFPKILQDTIMDQIKRHKPPSSPNWITLTDLNRVANVLKDQFAKKDQPTNEAQERALSELDEVSSDSLDEDSSDSETLSDYEESEESEAEDQVGQRKKINQPKAISSKTPNRQCSSMVHSISALWNNKTWQQVKIRQDLEPVSLLNPHAVKPLLEIARLTPSSHLKGFPPIVVKALLEALEDYERRRPTFGGKSSKGWSQSKVIENALELVKVSVQSQDSGSIQATTSSSSSSSLKPSEFSFSESESLQQVDQSLPSSRIDKASSDWRIGLKVLEEGTNARFAQSSMSEEKKLEWLAHLQNLKDFYLP